jgi:hypothetical protein
MFTGMVSCSRTQLAWQLLTLGEQANAALLGSAARGPRRR